MLNAGVGYVGLRKKFFFLQNYDLFTFMQVFFLLVKEFN